MTDTIPQYQSSSVFAAVDRDAALDIMARLIEHRRNSTTDMAPEQRREPIAKYLDKELWEREIAEIFHRIPLPVATSAELSEIGDFKAMRVVGREIILVRGKDGAMKAMLNVCRHRSMKLVPEGCGSARRFTCGYHSWTYDTDGTLTGVPSEDTFGPVDREDNSLVGLACEERAGIIFVVLTAGLPMDIDGWLGDALPLLEQLGLNNTHHFSTRELAGPNWKVTVDGYLEGYHFSSLHAKTVALTNHTNMAAYDAYGPHMRNVFALKAIDGFLDTPREEWEPAEALGLVYWIFPGMAIAGGWRERAVVSIMLPGDTWAESMTRQTTLLRTRPETAEEILEAERTADWFFAAFRDEDYTAQADVMNGLSSLADKDMIIGRNEPGVQHVHESIDRLLRGDSVH
jgi:phenylpropionate dioxygenase-like ring-hydroxylating dioxygenase large terminal subunit